MSTESEQLVAAVGQFASEWLHLLFAVLRDIVEAAELELFIVFRDGDELRVDIPEHHLELSQLLHTEQEVSNNLLAMLFHQLTVADNLTKSKRKDLQEDAHLHPRPLKLLEMWEIRCILVLCIQGGPQDSLGRGRNVFLFISL